MRKLICALTVGCLLCAGVLVAQETKGLDQPEWYGLLREALASGMLEPDDITVKRDFITPDPFRLKISIDWLEKPFLIPGRTNEIAASFAKEKSLASIFAEASSLKDNPANEFKVTLPEPSADALFEELTALEGGTGNKLDMSKDDFNKAIADLPQPLVDALCCLTSASRLAHDEAEKAYAGLNKHEIAYIIENVSKITTEGQVPAPEMPEKLYGFIKRIEQQHIANAAMIVCIGVDKAREALSTLDENTKKKTAIDEKRLLEIETPYGPIIVGGAGTNSYRETAFIVIDLGGDNEYRGQPCSVTKRLNNTSIIIDLAGNDLYHTREDYAIASSICGFAVLVDENGDDEYTGAHHVEASGTLGLGMLVDVKGTDRYFGDTASQATGYFGYGILVDFEGNDFYTAYMNSQAHAQVNGAAFLLDFDGNDVYFAGNKYKDYREGQKYYGSLSQGFAIGARPNYSAGIGGLFDYAGNDSYISDYFAQGSSYWFGIGILYDKEGDDQYVSRRYSQGSGIHLSTGVLVDMAGNDRYTSWGVSQGCGHDISQGILFDKSGNDSYYANWLSQGAGNANGYGMLIDLDGNDRYIGEKVNMQAAGTYTRKKEEEKYARSRAYTSIGILIDGNGKDYYTHGAGDNSFWRNGYFGVGYDTTKPPANDSGKGGAEK